MESVVFQKTRESHDREDVISAGLSACRGNACVRKIKNNWFVITRFYTWNVVRERVLR